MKVDIKKLTKKDIGRWVEYQAWGDRVEEGRIKSWNDFNVFVVYKCGGDWDNYANYTGCATNPEDLIFQEEKEEEVGG